MFNTSYFQIFIFLFFSNFSQTDMDVVFKVTSIYVDSFIYT